MEYFSYFFQKTGFYITLMKTICMKYQILFSGKNKKSITNLSSAEVAQSVVKVKEKNLKINGWKHKKDPEHHMKKKS